MAMSNEPESHGAYHAGLDRFLAHISRDSGMPIGEFQSELVDLFEVPRSRQDLDDYRLSRGPWKKLADEVSPVSQFFRYLGIVAGSVRFPLDSIHPDCWLTKSPGVDPIGVEVTIAMARQRFHVATEMVQTGVGRGFLGKRDDAPKAEFDAAMARRRTMYSTEHALKAVRDGVLRCMAKKDQPKFAGYILLIEAPFRSIPESRWSAIEDELRQAASPLPFAEVHVVSDAYEDTSGMRLK